MTASEATAIVDPLPALVLSRISKRYDLLAALDDVGLVVRPGTIHALLGENGAGKSTLMRIAYGLEHPDSGRILVAGRTVRFAHPNDAIATGLGMVHQHFTLVPDMTVAENLSLGGHGVLRRNDAVQRIADVSNRTGFSLDANALAGSLSVGAQQRVEIAKALSRNASLLILDEPTAVLAPAEIDGLLQWLRSYVADGNAVVLITHKLREALAVAADVTVLRRGRVVYSGVADGISATFLADAMTGELDTLTTDVTERTAAMGDGDRIFCAEHVSIADAGGRVRVRDATFSVTAGDIVGIVAIEGSGQRELLRALAGRHAVLAGRLERPTCVGFVPEDRHHDAVLLGRTLAENVALRDAGRRRGRIDWGGVSDYTVSLMHEFDVRGSGASDVLSTLSGGNQQKLVLARELTRSLDGFASRGLVVENPTRGLDVRAMADVHARLRSACARGMAIVFYSNDLDEVLALSSRVLVLSDGHLREMPLERASISRAMLGVS